MRLPSFIERRKPEWVGAGLALGAFLLAFVPLMHATHEVARAAPVATVTIVQRNRHFIPNRATILRGTVLHIVNDDRYTHHVNVDSPKMKFDSGDNPVGTSVDVEFDHRGTFDVECAIHPLMHLWVTVK